jgi:hypothetical protein
MMDKQRTIQAAKPKNERIYIGGEIELYHLVKGGFIIETLSRFDDYEQTEKSIIQRRN